MKRKAGGYTVIEGNRRLATLMILHQVPAAGDLRFDLDPTDEQLRGLREIPCFEIPNREAADRFLGFRHIGGIKTWSPEAKARYLADAVDRAHENGASNPFREVGRHVGSNAQGVRNSYVAIAILRHASAEFGLDVRGLQYDRFGVWLRALNAPPLRAYIGLGDIADFEDIAPAFKTLKKGRLREVIADLVPGDGSRSATVPDSRALTDYSRVLASEEARSVLRQYNDLALASRIVNESELPDRLDNIRRQLELVLGEIRTAKVTEELRGAATAVSNVARSILGAVKEHLKAEDDE
jgi:hypothetical protein